MRTEHPGLETERLVLRAFALEDARDVRRLAGEREIAAMTLTVPHPYEDGMAEAWIEKQRRQAAEGALVNYAVTLREAGTLIGAIGLMLQWDSERAELGYWIGKPYWGRGYATEAARALVEYGFRTLGLNRIYAHCMAHNPASARVMIKLGMVHEGRLRQHLKKWGEFTDIEQYAILRSDYEERHTPSAG